MTQALALRRLRVRRRRPPSGRALLALAWVVLTLAQAARALIEVLNGDAWALLFLAFYVLFYLGWRRVHAYWRRREEDERPMPSVTAIEWLTVAVFSVLTVEDLLTL